MNPINLAKKFELFQDTWSPQIIAELNNQYVKLAKVQGEFVWHNHANEDELFVVLKGTLIMEFKGKTVEVNPGEILVVPKGVDHLPKTKNEEVVHLMLIEPKETKHTGEVIHEKTKTEIPWI